MRMPSARAPVDGVPELRLPSTDELREPSGFTRSTSGSDLGVMPGIVKMPTARGVTRTMSAVVTSVAPLMISMRCD